MLFSKYRALSKNAKLLTSSFTIGSGDMIIWFLFSIYLNELGLGKSEIGWIIFVMSMAGTLPLIPLGYLSDRYGKRKFVFFGIFVGFAGAVILCLTDIVFWLYLASALLGLEWAAYYPSFFGWLSDSVGAEAQKYAFSLCMFASTFTTGIAQFFAGRMPQFFANLFTIPLVNGFRWAFFVSVIFMLLQIIPLCLAKPSSVSRKSSGSIISAFKTKTILMLSLPQMLIGFGAGFVLPFFQLYFIWRFHTPISVIGTIFAITSFIWCFGYLLVPYLAEKFGDVRTIVSLWLPAILVLICMPLSPMLSVFAILYIVRMILMNVAAPIYDAYAVNIVPPQHKSLTLSAIGFAFSLFNSFSPAIAGYVYEVNINIPFYICASLYIFGTLIFLICFRTKKRPL